MARLLGLGFAGLVRGLTSQTLSVVECYMGGQSQLLTPGVGRPDPGPGSACPSLGAQGFYREFAVPGHPNQGRARQRPDLTNPFCVRVLHGRTEPTADGDRVALNFALALGLAAQTLALDPHAQA